MSRNDCRSSNTYARRTASTSGYGKRDAVALRELEHQLGLERPFDVQMELGLRAARASSGLDRGAGAGAQRRASRPAAGECKTPAVAAVLLGLLIAAAFGSGDFVGGRASAAASTVDCAVVSQACSVAGALGARRSSSAPTLRRTTSRTAHGRGRDERRRPRAAVLRARPSRRGRRRADHRGRRLGRAGRLGPRAR